MPEENDSGENPETRVLVPEVVEEENKDTLSPRENGLIDDAVRFINQTVKAMVLNAALRIGDYLLTVFFHNDIKRATSCNGYKDVSFNALCRRPEISLDRRELAYMVKIAAQERFIRQIDFDTSGLNYSHRKYLTRLPDGGKKVELINECVNDGLSARELLLRVKEIEKSGKTAADFTPELMIRGFITRMDRSMQKISIPETLSDETIFSGLSPDTQMELQSKTMQWMEHLENIRNQCSTLLEMLENDAGSPP